MGRICVTLSSCVLDQAWRFEDKCLAEEDTTTCMTVKWGFCFLTQLECKALSHSLLLCNADKEEKKTFTLIQRVRDTEMCSVAYLGNTNILVSAIFFNSLGPPMDLWYVWSSHLLVNVMLWIPLTSFFIWANSEKRWLNWSSKLLHVSGVFFVFIFFNKSVTWSPHSKKVQTQSWTAPVQPGFLACQSASGEMLSTRRTLVWTTGFGDCKVPGCECVGPPRALNVWND